MYNNLEMSLLFIPWGEGGGRGWRFYLNFMCISELFPLICEGCKMFVCLCVYCLIFLTSQPIRFFFTEKLIIGRLRDNLKSNFKISLWNYTPLKIITKYKPLLFKIG